MNNILMIDFVIRCSFGILGVLMVAFGVVWGIISKSETKAEQIC